MKFIRKKKRRWHVLIELIELHGWKSGVELGVLGGQNILNLIKECPDLHMVGVDLWEPQRWQESHRDAGGRSYAGVDLNRLLKVLKCRIVERGYQERIELLQMSTLSAASEFIDPIMRGSRPSFDFVFVDADHMEDGVREDIKTWEPLVKVGGMILGHDYQKDFPGVIKVVDEIFPDRTLYADSVWGAVV